MVLLDHPAPGISLGACECDLLQQGLAAQSVQFRPAFLQVHFVLAASEHRANLEHSQHVDSSILGSRRLRLRARGLSTVQTQRCHDCVEFHFHAFLACFSTLFGV